MVDFKDKIDEIVDKIQNDKSLKAKFEKDPVSAIEEIIGVDLPNDKINQLVEGIKAKLTMNSDGSKLGGLFGKK